MADGGNRNAPSPLLRDGRIDTAESLRDPRLDSPTWPWNFVADLAEEKGWDDPELLRIILRELRRAG